MSTIHTLGNVGSFDLQGEKTKTAMYLPATGATNIADALALLKALVPLLVACSDAGIHDVLASELIGYVGSVGDPAVQKYNSCSDKAVLKVLTEAGTIVHPEIPAPINGLFLSDDFTVDLTAINALTATLIANGCCDDAGNLYTVVLGGYRSSIGARPLKPGGQ